MRRYLLIVLLVVLAVAGCDGRTTAQAPAAPDPVPSATPATPAPQPAPASVPATPTEPLPAPASTTLTLPGALSTARLVLLNPATNQRTTLLVHNGSAGIEPGTYQVLNYSASLRSGSSSWAVSGQPRQAMQFTVAAGETKRLDFGPPLRGAVEITPSGTDMVSMAIKITDAAGNPFSINGDPRPQPPTFKVLQAGTNEQVMSGSFEYG